MKRIFAISNLALLAAILLTGCSKQNSIVGRWIDDERGGVEYTFFADGTFAAKRIDIMEGMTYSLEFMEKMTYSLEGNQIKFCIDGEEGGTVDYSINGEKLTITDDGKTDKKLTFRKAK